METSAIKKLNWHDIVERILASYNVISKSINPANLYKIELTSAQIKVLATFIERKCYTMTALSQVLSVALPTMVAHSYLLSRVDKYEARLQSGAVTFLKTVSNLRNGG